MPNMESGFGWHYPPGTPGPRSEPGSFKCQSCGETSDVVITHDLGAADVLPEECPSCGEPWTGEEELGEYEGPDPDDERDRLYERQQMENEERGEW